MTSSDEDDKDLDSNSDPGASPLKYRKSYLKKQIANKKDRPLKGASLFQMGLYAQLADDFFLAEKSYYQLLNARKKDSHLNNKAAINLALSYIYQGLYNRAKATLAEHFDPKNTPDKMGKNKEANQEMIYKRDLINSFILFKEDRMESALRHIESLIEKNPSYVPAYSLLAHFYIEKGSFILAKKVIKRGKSFKRNHPDLAFLEGIIYLRQGDSSKAKAVFNKLSRKSVHQAISLNQLGLIHFNETKYKQAEKHFAQAGKLDSSQLEPYNNLAITYQKQKKYKEAEATFLQILEEFGDKPKIHYNLSVLYLYFLKQPQKAKEHYDLYRRLKER